MPFAYSIQERLDLEHYLRPHHDDPDGTLIRWAQQFLYTDEPNSTREVLARINAHIGKSLKYAVRHEEGTQTPLETLELGGGTCRDYALLMMEAARRLGIATRFVSGYLYDAALDASKKQADGKAMTGAGSTHAWLHAYLPGAGWVAFDPTNNIMGGNQLIRVGVARDPAQAAPDQRQLVRRGRGLRGDGGDGSGDARGGLARRRPNQPHQRGLPSNMLRAMICFITSIEPPAMRVMRASA